MENANVIQVCNSDSRKNLTPKPRGSKPFKIKLALIKLSGTKTTKSKVLKKVFCCR